MLLHGTSASGAGAYNSFAMKRANAKDLAVPKRLMETSENDLS